MVPSKKVTTTLALQLEERAITIKNPKTKKTPDILLQLRWLCRGFPSETPIVCKGNRASRSQKW